MGLGEEKGLSRNAALVMFATFFSRITGFLRTVLIKNIMSPKGYSDEFLVAFSLPDLTFELLVGGAIAAAIIPILTSSISKNNEREGWKAIGTFLNITVIAFIFISIIFFIFTPSFVEVVAIGYEKGTEEFNLVVKLTRILLPSSLFMILAGQCNGILNAYNKFAAAAFGPVLYNLCVMISIIIFGARSVELTTFGVTISAIIYFLVQLSCTWKHLRMYKPQLYLRNETFLKLVKLAVPSLAASAVVQVNGIISRSFSTEFVKNSVTMMNNANRTWQLPLGIFAQSLGVAMLPTLSSQFALEEKESYKRVLNKGLRTVMALCIPSTMILIVLNREIMQILFKWSKMSNYEVAMNGLALLAYAPALLFQSVVVILNRAFYSIQNTRIPLLIGVGTIGINIAANLYFSNYTDLGAIGTAMAYVVTVLVNAFLLVILFSRKTGLELIPDNFIFLAKITAVTIISGITLWICTLIIPFPAGESFSFGRKVLEILSVCARLVLPLLVFIVTSVLFKIDEIRKFLASILIKISDLKAKSENRSIFAILFGVLKQGRKIKG